MLSKLVKLSNHLDSIGSTRAADYLDLIIKEAATDKSDPDALISRLVTLQKSLDAIEQSADSMKSDKALAPFVSQISKNELSSFRTQAEKLSAEIQNLPGNPNKDQLLMNILGNVKKIEVEEQKMKRQLENAKGKAREAERVQANKQDKARAQMEQAGQAAINYSMPGME